VSVGVGVSRSPISFREPRRRPLSAREERGHPVMGWPRLGGTQTTWQGAAMCPFPFFSEFVFHMHVTTDKGAVSQSQLLVFYV
jgi:hypothetical protein